MVRACFPYRDAFAGGLFEMLRHAHDVSEPSGGSEVATVAIMQGRHIPLPPLPSFSADALVSSLTFVLSHHHAAYSS